VHKAYSDATIKALIGSREDIPANLQAGIKPIHDAAVQ